MLLNGTDFKHYLYTVLYGEANCKIKRIMEEKILCSAIWYKELELKKPEVLEPRNYRPHNCEDRKEGAKIALETNQIEKLQYGNQLYSEDLW